MAASRRSTVKPRGDGLALLLLISLLSVVVVAVSATSNNNTTELTTSSSAPFLPSPSPSPPASSSSKLVSPAKGFFLPSLLVTSKSPSTSTTLKPPSSNSYLNSTTVSSITFLSSSSSSSSTSSPLPSTTMTTFEPLPEPLPQQPEQAPRSSGNLFKWNSVSSGQQNDLSFRLNCTPDYMTIEVNLSRTLVDQDASSPVYVYLEKLKSFDICRPKIAKGIATFHLALDDNFYRCGTMKVHDQRTGTRVYYNRVIVEDKKASSGSTNPSLRSVYFKCSLPSASRIIAAAVAAKAAAKHQRPKRQSSLPANRHHRLGAGQLVNFTEIDLPDNFMEAEILDLDGNITARAPYPHLNLKVKRNGQLVNTSLNVAPGTPLEMIIYLDDESKPVYGLLASFLKVTDSTQAQLRAQTSSSSPPKEEVIVLNGCSIDPYIFGNFETPDGGDSVAAKFRAFKFPESNYVMFVGTVNVCLGQCSGVPCGGGGGGDSETVAFGRRRRRRRRRRRSVPDELPRDPNKVFEIEMTTYLQIGYTAAEEAAANKRRALQGDSFQPSRLVAAAASSQQQQQQAQASRLTQSSHQQQQTLPTTTTNTASRKQLANSASGKVLPNLLPKYLSIPPVLFVSSFFFLFFSVHYHQ